MSDMHVPHGNSCPSYTTSVTVSITTAIPDNIDSQVCSDITSLAISTSHSTGGTMPTQLGNMPALTQLNFSDMRLDGTMPASVLHTCKPFGTQTTCDGLPPASCG